jgi:hypothetical protein
VTAWLDAGEGKALARQSCQRPGGDVCEYTQGLDEPAYAYLLGQYLGDGCISRIRKSFRLRIMCCDAYPKIIEECADAIQRVRIHGRVGYLQREGCTEVSNYWLHWPCLLPHGTGGLKHQRTIALLPWQRTIAIERHPDLLIRGLIHSDGWRGINRVRGANGHPYAYPRYQFSNRSEDIKQLFVEACARVGVECRRMNRMTVSVAERTSVARLDEFVGPKS